jgi:membrane-bound metal-dependent hydrolase YbcI (DUF457 family)
MSPLPPAAALKGIKIIHSVVWAFFAACIVAIPVFAWRGDYARAVWMIGIVFVECVVLVLNRMRCPLTPVAARYTEDRRDNFDIYLPEWLARHNKLVFGSLYVAGILFTLARWAGARP